MSTETIQAAAQVSRRSFLKFTVSAAVGGE